MSRHWKPKQDRYEIVVYPEYTVNHLNRQELVQWRYYITDLKTKHIIHEGRSLGWQVSEDACKDAEQWLAAHKRSEDAGIEDAFKYTMP
jgi:hypothetical protein